MLKIQSSTECKFQVTGAKACSNKKQSKTAKLQARDRVLQHKVASQRDKAAQGCKPEGQSFAAQSCKSQGQSFAAQSCKPEGQSLAAQSCKPEGQSFAAQSCKPQGQSFAAQSCSATQVAVHNVQICIIYIYIILIPIDIDNYRYRYRCGTNNTTVGEPKNSSLFPAHRNSQGSWLVWCVTPKYLSNYIMYLIASIRIPPKKRITSHAGATGWTLASVRKKGCQVDQTGNMPPPKKKPKS